METPIMVVVSILAARWVVRVWPCHLHRLRLAICLVALALLLVAELTLVLWLRGLTISEYLASRDPVAGTVYFIALGVFAVMPIFVARR